MPIILCSLGYTAAHLTEVRVSGQGQYLVIFLSFMSIVLCPLFLKNNLATLHSDILRCVSLVVSYLEKKTTNKQINTHAQTRAHTPHSLSELQ